MPFFVDRSAFESFPESDPETSDDELTAFEEPRLYFKTRELATAAACKFVKDGGANLTNTQLYTIYRSTFPLSPYKDKIVGIEQAAGAPINFRIRCDWDLKIGYHFNAEYGKGKDERQKTAFVVEGKDENAYKTHMKWLTKQDPERTAVEIKRLWMNGNGFVVGRS